MSEGGPPLSFRWRMGRLRRQEVAPRLDVIADPLPMNDCQDADDSGPEDRRRDRDSPCAPLHALQGSSFRAMGNGAPSALSTDRPPGRAA
jgi:hypothetical protein